MFDSKVTAKELIEEIRQEADISLEIPDENYIAWLNSLEQMLYSEIIKEQGKRMFDTDAAEFEGVIGLANLDVPDGEDGMRFEDIHAVYRDGTQLIKSTLASGVLFPDTYYKISGGIGFNLKETEVDEIKVIYFVRPKLKTIENYNSANVMLPVEFIDLAKAKLRAEGYKLANEDNLAAKWINDYNVLVETFRAWVEGKRANFGL